MPRSLLALVIGILSIAGPAAADNMSWHATASGSVAATDNVFAVPRSEDPQADVYMQLRPGVLFAYDSPRTIHELIAEAEFLEYVVHSDNPSFTGRFAWLGTFLPSPRTRILLSTDASRGVLNALSSRTAPDQTGINVLPSSSEPIDVSQASGSQYLSWVAGKDTRLSEAAYATWTATNDNQPQATTTSVFETGIDGTFDHGFHANTLALEAGASYLRLERIAPATANPGSTLQRQFNPHGRLIWFHDFNKHWSADVDAGFIYVNPIGHDHYNPLAETRSAPFPLFGALVAYTETWGRASITARRGVAPDMFIAMNTVDDTLLAQLALPLPWLDDNPHLRAPKFVGLGSLGFERAQLVNTDTSVVNGSFFVAHVDLGVAWTPRPGQTYGVRYELLYQHGDATAVLITPSFYRNTLYFTFAVRYPDRIAAKMPLRSQSVRADRKDLAPIGAEPVVPDPSEVQGGDDDGDRSR